MVSFNKIAYGRISDFCSAAWKTLVGCNETGLINFYN